MGFEEDLVTLANLAGIVVIVVQPSLFRGLEEQVGMAGLGKPRSPPRNRDPRDPKRVV